MPISLENSTPQSASEFTLRNVKVVLSWSAKTSEFYREHYGIFDFDLAAFLLNAENKVVRNDGFIFYGNPQSPCRSIRHSGDDLTGDNGETITARLSTLPAEIHKVLFSVSIHGGQDVGQVFGKTEAAGVCIIDADTNEEIYNFDLDDAQGDRSVLVGLLKRHGNEWIWQMLGNGGNAPLNSIAKKYGVDTKAVRLTKGSSESPQFNFWQKKKISDAPTLAQSVKKVSLPNGISRWLFRQYRRNQLQVGNWFFPMTGKIYKH